MKLKIKLLKWSAGVPVAMLNKETAMKMGIQVGSSARISLNTMKKPFREFSSSVNVIEGLVKEDEIAVSSEIENNLALKKRQEVDVNLTEMPASVFCIRKKLEGKPFTKEDIRRIIFDIVKNELSEGEIALFISTMYERGMSFKETVYLIEAILAFGNKLKLKGKLIADKHSIGGIAGNRTTPIVVSICAAAGLIMPKTSSRAITSAAGTADTIEVLAPVEFSIGELKKIIKKTGAFLIWEGPTGMVPADSQIIRVEKSLKIDPEAQLLASIMSKKLAVGSKYILIDISYGKGAKVNLLKALLLKRKFERLGKYFHKKLRVVLTEGDKPVGRGIGPVLEMTDILNVLNPGKKGPEDLKIKSLSLAGELLELTGKAEKGKGFEKAKEILGTGKAFEKFRQIISAQGGSVNKALKPGKFKHDILANKKGIISEIDNRLINLIARNAGCPADKKAGIYLHANKGDRVKKSQKLFTIYSESESRLDLALKFCQKNSPINIK